MKIISIVGARPQFIKAAAIHRALDNYEDINRLIIHTGQHYDENMSEIFFKELDIPKPSYNLNIGSSSHGKQTGMMLLKIEEVLIREKPDCCIVYGDTNSTIAGALASIKLNIPVAHVEAGLRSFNRSMPEEINRIVTDHISTLLLAPTQNAVNILKHEGLQNRTFFSGDVMYDSVLFYNSVIEKNKIKFMEIDFPYYLATIHRQENSDDEDKLTNIITAFTKLDKKVILPLHPRTKKQLKRFNIKISSNIKIIDPVGYLDMIFLLKRCEKVFTDSGGLQKEAYFLKKPCITLRNETEWTETLQGDWNVIAGTDLQRILHYSKVQPTASQEEFFGNGKASEIIVRRIIEDCNFK